MMRKFLLTWTFGFLSLAAISQSRNVTGQVTSLDDGTTLPGVNVLVKGTTIGTVTDADGRYSVQVPESATALVFSFIGLATQEVAIAGRTSIDVQMASDAKQLSEVVVVAYGIADKRSFTGSVGEISSDAIQKRPLTNVSNALVGTIAGVQTNAASGQPGSAPDIRVRGITSINGSSSPLYIVDGVPYDQGISNLNSNDIESISVLKDAGSTSLYGSRAANGVVMITTKRGKEGKSRLNLRVEHGATSRAIPEYERVNAREYYTLMWEAYRNSLSISGATPEATANQMATDNISGLLGYNPFNVPGNQLVSTSGVFNPSAKLLYNDLDWFDPITRNGSRSDYNINYSGGLGNTDYLVSIGYLDEKGYIINSDFERYTARLNVNTKPLNWLNTGLNVAATYTESKNARTGGSTAFVNPFNFARNIGPIYPVYEHDPVTGEFILDDNGKKVYDLGFGPPARPAGASPGRHIVQETKLNQDLFKRTVISGRSYVEAEFLKNFSFRATAGIDLFSFYDLGYDNKIVGDGAPSGRASRDHSTETSLTLNQILKYRRTLAERHNVEALVGHESYSFVDNNFSGSRQGQIVDGNTELINFTDINSVTSSTSDDAMESYFMQVQYDYDGKYFFTASVRRDGSSRFAEDARWGNFYSVGGSWRLENEAFISNIPWIDALKLRATYGETGNRDVGGFYPGQGLYALGFNNAAEPGYLQSNLANEDLRWEKNVQYDIGTDFVLFNGRLSGSIEYYNRVSKDLLFNLPLPISSGSPDGTIAKNIAEMSNKGFEVQLSGDVIKMGDFAWNVNVNISSFKNEITDLPVDEFVSGTKKWKEGRSVFDYWLREYYGVNPANGAPLYRLNTENNVYSEPNDMVIGTDTLTSIQSRAAFHYSGSAIPDLYGGITNTVRYKNFTLTILTTYQIGGKVYDAGYQNLLGGADYGDAIHKDALKRWRQPGDKTNVPRVDVANNPNSGATSDRWLTSATHLNLRQVTLNYDLPRTLLSKAGIQNASFYISGENLKLFSKRQGMNVLQNFSGVTSNAYIPNRVFTVGLSVGL
jgi:TonB-linked SusC/RagA family outer membrane protein